MRAVTAESWGAEPILAVACAAEWRAWLLEHHARFYGVLLRIAKKGAPKAVTARFIAMCVRHETIHPRPHALDDTIPARKKNGWPKQQ